jgi:hypothetical protein
MTIQDFLASSKVHDASFADRWRNNNKGGPKTSFFDFSHCRLFPLEYRLPARFETMTRSHLRANRERLLKFQLLPRRINLRQTRGSSLLEFRSCALPAFGESSVSTGEEKAAFDYESVSDLSHPGQGFHVTVWTFGRVS